MTHHLCISVTFLDPLFHGTGDEQVPEWPPSPMRLLQALVAGSYTGCRSREWSEAKTQAFEWLEACEPPKIVAPVAIKATPYTLFVPNNDSDAKFDRQERLTTKPVRPHWLWEGDTVHYLWPIGEEEWSYARDYIKVLCLSARHMLALGWGIDQVVGNGRVLNKEDVVALSGQRWEAHAIHRPGQIEYRVPKADSLADLRDVHESFINRVQGKQFQPSLKLRVYDKVGYFRRTQLPPRPYAIFELPEGVALRQARTAEIAAWLRMLTNRLAEEDGYDFPGGRERYVMGRSDGDAAMVRFSYLPLPTIGHAHADGLIRRLLIAEPFGGDSSCAAWAQHRLRNRDLPDGNSQTPGLLLEPWRNTSKDLINRYVGESRTWCTVTPVILPGYDDFKAIAQHDEKKPTKAERLLFKCLRHAGIPLESVASITMRRAPFWSGSLHPRHYNRPDYLADHGARPGWHVRLVFHDPVSGPLAIGAGRHCGLGVFAVIEK